VSNAAKIKTPKSENFCIELREKKNRGGERGTLPSQSGENRAKSLNGRKGKQQQERQVTIFGKQDEKSSSRV